MTNYSLNTGHEEQDRSLIDEGFNGMSHHTTTPTVGKESGVPYNKPSPLSNQVNPSSNTSQLPFPSPAGDMARRTD
jgi:hypothetical protein